MVEVLDEKLSLDCNVASEVSNEWDLSSFESAIVYVVGTTGSHLSHKINMEISPNNIDWFTTNVTITGEDYQELTDTLNYKYIRFKVAAVEGAASTVDIWIQGTRSVVKLL